MKQLLGVITLGAALSAGSAFAAGRTMVGYISDTKCATSGASKANASEWIQPAAFENCVKDCVKSGSAAVFVTEDNKILTFDKASVAKITPFLGRKVSVTGSVKDHTLKVDGITGLKM